MPDNTTLDQIIALLQDLDGRIARIEASIGSGLNDYKVIRHLSDPNLYQLGGTKRYRPDFWFTSNLFFPYAETDEQRAFIQLNVGTDSAGNLVPVYGQLFAQANTWNDDGITVGTSPQVYAVKQSGAGRWERNTEAPYLAPAGTNHPIYYAARFRTADQLIEWTRRTAAELDNPNFGSGNFSPSPSGG